MSYDARLLTLISLLMLSACASTPPPPQPSVVRVPTYFFVPVPDELTTRCAWEREAPPSRVFDVAAGRRRCLLHYESQLRRIRSIGGQPAPEEWQPKPEAQP